MKITKMIVDSKNKDKVHIFVDNEPYTTISAELVFSLKLKKDEELTLDVIDKLFFEQKVSEAFTKCLSLLSRSLKTKRQIITYLKEKEFSYNVIEQTLIKLENINLINDEIYTKKYIESEKNKKGKLAIKSALIQKGVEKSIIEKELDLVENQNEVIDKLASKYLKNKVIDLKTIQKLNRFLLSKGFSYSEINECIGKIDYESGN